MVCRCVLGRRKVVPSRFYDAYFLLHKFFDKHICYFVILIFVKNLLLAEHVYFQQTALVSLLVVNLFMHNNYTEDITNYC